VAVPTAAVPSERGVVELSPVIPLKDDDHVGVAPVPAEVRICPEVPVEPFRVIGEVVLSSDSPVDVTTPLASKPFLTLKLLLNVAKIHSPFEHNYNYSIKGVVYFNYPKLC
jgi:hypothetical protein